jgi:hypothetical protein
VIHLARPLAVMMLLLLPALASAELPPPGPLSLDVVAREYVKLALALGVHDLEYVDSYYGPPEWKAEADSLQLTLPDIEERAMVMVGVLVSLPPDSSDEMVTLRRAHLLVQLRSLAARSRMLSGPKPKFDEESRELYDAVSPSHPDSFYARVLKRLNVALPGPGPLTQRYEAFQKKFVIPPARLDTVIQAAIAECRARTLRHIALPPEERYTVEYVKGKSWAAYNWYQGGYHSLIQINTDLPIRIESALSLSGHEGYPGHHVNAVLYERDLVKGRGWVEFSVLPLFSPQCLIAEGSANFGLEVMFTPAERLEFERRVLFPLAGLDPATASRYEAVRALTRQLGYASNDAGRRYLDGRVDSVATVAWLSRYALRTPARAAQQIRFFNEYRSYIINYNLGQDIVRKFVESHGGTPEHSDERWHLYEQVIGTPRTPEGLQ